MLLVHDPRCTAYGTSDRPERPARLDRTVPHLRRAHPDWTWLEPSAATPADAALCHSPAHLDRLHVPVDFDPDTPHFPATPAPASPASATASIGRYLP